MLTTRQPLSVANYEAAAQGGLEAVSYVKDRALR